MEQRKNTSSGPVVKGSAGKIHIDDGGYGEIPVLLVHSFGGSSKHWEAALINLRQNRRAIAFDLRGHGLSDPSHAGEYSVQAMAEDIAAVADQLKLKKFILVGHSIGGSAAIEYASLHPSRLAGLVLLSTPGKSSPELAKQVLAALHSDKYEAVMADYMEKLLVHAEDHTRKLVLQGMRKLDKKTSLAIIQAAFDYDPVPALNSYEGPALILYTDAETDQPNALYKAFPGIQSLQFRQTSHWLQIDAPSGFNNILEDFTERVENSESQK